MSAAGTSGTPSSTGNKPKSQLVTQAEQEDRQRALIKGYLRKENSASKWQKRWFEVVGRYFVYYKTSESPGMLCAMDLYRASTPEVVTQPDEAGNAVATSTFAIRWDRYRVFKADSPEEAVRWVNVMKAVQAANPANAVRRPSQAPAAINQSSAQSNKCCTIS